MPARASAAWWCIDRSPLALVSMRLPLVGGRIFGLFSIVVRRVAVPVVLGGRAIGIRQWRSQNMVAGGDRHILVFAPSVLASDLHRQPPPSQSIAASKARGFLLAVPLG